MERERAFLSFFVKLTLKHSNTHTISFSLVLSRSFLLFLFSLYLTLVSCSSNRYQCCKGYENLHFFFFLVLQKENVSYQAPLLAAISLTHSLTHTHTHTHTHAHAQSYAHTYLLLAASSLVFFRAVFFRFCSCTRTDIVVCVSLHLRVHSSGLHTLRPDQRTKQPRAPEGALKKSIASTFTQITS